MKKHFLAACLAVIPGLSQADWSGEIAGVKLGMTLDQAKAAVAKANPKLQIEDKKTPDGAPWGFVALDATGADNQWNVDYVVVAVDNGKVWYAGRRQLYPEGARPSVKAFFEALGQKYEPFNVYPDTGREKTLRQIEASGKFALANGYSGAWVYDRSGKPNEAACRVSGWEAFDAVPAHSRLKTDPVLVKAGLAGQLFGNGGYSFTDLKLPKVAVPTCGRRAVFAVSGVGPNGLAKPDFVASMGIWAADLSGQYDRALAQKQAAEAQQRQATQAELAKGAKPSF